METSLSPSRRQMASYGVLALPVAFAGVPLYLHAPDFYARTTSLTLSMIGATLLLLRFVDAVQDPLIGWMSDRYRRHRPIIITLGAVCLSGGFWMVFHPVYDAGIGWFSLSIFVSTTGYSLLSINLLAAGGEWKTDDSLRVAINGARESFTLLGVMLASAIPTLLMLTYAEETAFSILTIGLVIMLVPCMIVFVRWHNLHLKQRTVDTTSRAIQWHMPTGRVRRFFLIYTLSQMASAMPAVLVIFFIRDRLELEAWTGLFLLIYFLSAAASMFLWQRLAKKVPHLALWRASMFLAATIFIFASFLTSGDLIAYVILCILSGAALGGELSLPPSILTKLAEEEENSHLLNQLFAQMTFLGKLALALATGLALPAVQLAGYVPSFDGVAAVNTLPLSVGYALVPALLKLLIALLSFRILSEVTFGVHHENRSSADGRVDVS